MGLLERAEALLVQLASRNDVTMRPSAVDAEAARFAHKTLWVSIAPSLGTVMLTVNGRRRLLDRGLLPTGPTARQPVFDAYVLGCPWC